MSKLLLAALLLSLLGSVSWGQNPGSPASRAPGSHRYGKGDRTRQMKAPPAATTQASGRNGIDYNGGPVILGTINVYYIWYGNWTGNYATAVSTLTTLAQNIGGSPYFNINTSYYQTVNSVSSYLSNSVAFGGSTTDNYSQGANLSDLSIYNIVAAAINSGALPSDPNGVYFVLTSQDVTENSGFCSFYCGWHTFDFVNNVPTKYAFVGNAVTQCPFACLAEQPGPNGNDGADGMASVLAHELEEATTDPELDAWFNDVTGQENADQCAWNFGPEQVATNGSAYNMTLGGLQYLIQQNWVNDAGGYCAQSWVPTPDFTISGSPSTQPVLRGASAQYTVTTGVVDGYTGNITLSVASGLPAGASASFGTNPVVNAGSSTLTISTTSSTPAGSYAITIQGTDGTLTHTTKVGLTVKVPDFSVTATPSSISVVRGKTSAPYTVTATPLNGFTGNVSYAVTGAPTGATAIFAANPVTVGGTAVKTTFTVAVPATVAVATYTLTVTGTGSSGTHSASVKLVVTGPDFTISATPSSRTVTLGANATYTVSIGAVNGFSSSVSLSVSGQPGRAVATFNPVSITPGHSSVLTIQTSAMLAPKTKILTITGTSGALVHSTTVTLIVQ